MDARDPKRATSFPGIRFSQKGLKAITTKDTKVHEGRLIVNCYGRSITGGLSFPLSK
jgi:hypothetical protein